MNVFGVVELTTARAARRREDEMARLRSAAVVAQAGGTRAMGRDLIALADHLDELVDDPAVTGRAVAAQAARAPRRRVEALLALCGITPIADDGELDFLRHEIVADRPAPHPGLVDHIAATVRRGYQWREDLLRAQQVIAYRAVRPRDRDLPS